MGRRVIYLAAAAAAIAAVVLPGTASAADPAICGTTITTSTTLLVDTSCSNTNADAITIGASGVTLNLGGHTLTSYDGDTAIKVLDGLSNVTIENGTIAAGAWDGVHDLGHQTSLTIENLTITSPYYRGISMHNDVDSLVQGNNITGAGEYGIYASDGASNSFFSNTLVDSGNPGFYSYEEQNDAIEGNEVTTTGNGNESAYNFEDYYGDMNLWYGNVSNGGGRGFYAYADGEGSITMTNNGARGPQFYGFYIDEFYPDTGTGTGPNTVITGNVATGELSTASGYYGGFYDYFNPGATWSGNTANRNAGNGFYFDEPWRETITANNGSYNGGDGFYLSTYGDEGAPLAFTNNTAWYNQDYGFEAEYGTTGGGDIGSNGGSPTNNGGDCYAVSGCS